MEEKNHKSNSSNGGAFLSVFFLTLSLVNVQGIYKLQWLGEHETRCQVSLIHKCFQKIATKMRQKPRFRGNVVTFCFDPAPAVCLLEGDLQRRFISPRT